MKAIRLNKDLASGAIFVLFGAYFFFNAQQYELGTPFKMGPGYMPSLLGVVLAGLGLAIAVTGWRKQDEQALNPSWLGAALILGAVLFFGFCIKGLGFIPTVFLTTLASALASRSNSIVTAILTGAVMCVLCVVIFVLGLGVQVPLIGPWLGM